MSKRAPDRSPDPMAGVVDRLLAQLPGLQGETSSSGRGGGFGSGSTPGPIVSSEPSELLGPWARVVLALSLGTTIGWWPYPRSCGLPLACYLGALLTIVLAAGWAAIASWRQRAKLAHTVSIILLFFGLLMTLAELLPRTGYAVDRAGWSCETGSV